MVLVFPKDLAYFNINVLLNKGYLLVLLALEQNILYIFSSFLPGLYLIKG